MEKKLGKITKAEFGQCGYQECMIGVSFTFEAGNWGVGDSWGDWYLKCENGAKWTNEERIVRLGEMVMKLNKILEDAKVHSVSELVGKPVEVTFEGNGLKSWRILKEVL